MKRDNRKSEQDNAKAELSFMLLIPFWLLLLLLGRQQVAPAVFLNNDLDQQRQNHSIFNNLTKGQHQKPQTPIGEFFTFPNQKNGTYINSQIKNTKLIELDAS